MRQVGEFFFDKFRQRLGEGRASDMLRDGLIGKNAVVDGPFGSHPLVYADYVASGRALRQIEEAVAEDVLPYYANSHTEASFCGQYMTRLREEARRLIARMVYAGEEYSVVFTGSGATAALNRLANLLLGDADMSDSARPLVLIGPFEHHSNILPWRESGAEVVEVPDGEDGGPDLAAVEARLRASDPSRRRIGAFSAASNVTGIRTDVESVNSLLKRHGAISVWDYAGAGPYIPIDMREGGGLDAVAVSTHKFVGGPAASGLMIVRRDVVRATRPTWPGGGTVTFVSPWLHDYTSNLASREEGGTPNIVGDIRAALAMVVKDAVGEDFIEDRLRRFNAMALDAWSGNRNLMLLGVDAANRLPIFSFRIRRRDGNGFVHHQLVTRMLSDVHGIQARGGCACAGPYAHRLLAIDAKTSTSIRDAILRGEEIEKPGWTRLNFSYLLTDEQARFIIDGVNDVSLRAEELEAYYLADAKTARFSWRNEFNS